MSDPYATMPPPPSTGNYPDKFMFTTPGQSVEGVIRDIRKVPAKGDFAECPALDIQTNQIGPDGQPACWSVFCNPTSLWRQLDAMRPPIGALVRITFKGHEGQAKVFTLEVAPGAPQPIAQPQPVAQPAPVAGFPPAEAYAQPQLQAAFAPAPPAQPEQPFGQPVATPPWGQ